MGGAAASRPADAEAGVLPLNVQRYGQTTLALPKRQGFEQGNRDETW
jgi:hypothetical protein